MHRLTRATESPNTRPASKAPEVRINKSGFITVNTLLVEAHLKDASHVKLMFDKEGNRIAIKPAAANDADTLRLSTTSGSKTKRIAGSGFLEFCDIKPQKNIVCPARWDAEFGAIVVDLPEGLKPGK